MSLINQEMKRTITVSYGPGGVFRHGRDLGDIG